MMRVQPSEFEIFSHQRLTETLGEQYPDLELRVFDEIDSTNTEAKRMVADGFFGTCLLLANQQSGGRGRMGRSFYSPGQTGAYFSILYPAPTGLDTAVTVTAAAAVAVMRAIRELTGIQTEIKWVNDLYLGGKKIAGILTEAVTAAEGTYVIVGIGVNLSTADFPGELSSIAGSLKTSEVTAADMAARAFRQLYPFLSDPADRSWIEDYRNRSCVLSKEICWNGESGVCEGRAVGIDEDGALLAETKNGSLVRLFSGEISVKAK